MKLINTLLFIFSFSISLFSQSYMEEKIEREKWENKMRTLPHRNIELTSQNINILETVSDIKIGNGQKTKISINFMSKDKKFDEEIFFKILLPEELSILPNSIIINKKGDIRDNVIYFEEPINKNELISISFNVITNSNFASKNLISKNNLKINYNFWCQDSSGNSEILYYKFSKLGNTLSFTK